MDTVKKLFIGLSLGFCALSQASDEATLQAPPLEQRLAAIAYQLAKSSKETAGSATKTAAKTTGRVVAGTTVHFWTIYSIYKGLKSLSDAITIYNNRNRELLVGYQMSLKVLKSTAFLTSAYISNAWTNRFIKGLHDTGHHKTAEAIQGIKYATITIPAAVGTYYGAKALEKSSAGRVVSFLAAIKEEISPGQFLEGRDPQEVGRNVGQAIMTRGPELLETVSGRYNTVRHPITAIRNAAGERFEDSYLGRFLNIFTEDNS